METILIVEDKDSMAKMLQETMEAVGYNPLIAKDGTEGIRKIRENKIDLVVTDLRLPKKDGMEVLRAAKEENPMLPVIVMTAFGTVDVAVRAIKEGAFDFITKPFDTDHLLHLIRKAMDTQRLVTENILLKDEVSSLRGMPTIIGKSEKILEAEEKIQKVAPTKATAFILGESGTGKELFARAIHCLSPRKDFPFVTINCAAIPRELLESELFGHEKGAFTGAEAKKLGKFELADGGTIFLDEIGEMELSVQSKILRVIQESEIERLGGIKPIQVNVRVIAATNKEIDVAVAEGRFREDLYYRLNVFPIRIPPLRERIEDIPLLVDFFLKKYCAEMKCGAKKVSQEVLTILKGTLWKGNVRELENTVERAIILCNGLTITPEHISLNPVPRESSLDKLAALPMNGTLEDTKKVALRLAESKRITKALQETRGNKTRAAELLDVSYKTLLTKIKEYSIE
ncbi:MAG TPA: sigma-54 dependent transcriptional regulator [Thermodesulfovibrionales bacterium]|nr:sigma-54 dependent transcriptional regulator [Thermodesulfovibrionales bacterium]